MDEQIVVENKKRIRDYLPVWLKNIHSMFYYFLFLVLMGFVFFGTTLFFNSFTTSFSGDYVMQQFSFYTNGYDDWWHFIRTGQFILYDENTFLGVDNIGSNSFYYLFDPFFMPILLVPRQLVPQGMAILTIFKIAASGMTFFLYMRYLGASRRASKITGFAYAFSGWMTWYLWFNHFTEIAIVLPMILLGIEMTIKEKKPWVLAGAMCIMGFTNFFFMLCFALCGFLYAMFRFFQTIKTRNWKDNLFVLLYGFCGFFFGILMPMLVVLPAAMHALNAPRAASSSYLGYLKDAFKAKNLKEIFQLLTSWTAKSATNQNKARSLYPFIDFIFPVMSDRGTPLTVYGNETYDNVAGSCFCYLPMMMLLVPAFIDSLGKKHYSVLVPLAFFLLALFTPFFYYAFHGFTEAYSRWTLFVTTSILAYTGLYLDKVDKKPFYILLIGFASLLVMLAVAGISAYYITLTYKTNFSERVPIWLALALEALYLHVMVGVLILIKFFKKPKFYAVFTGFITVEMALMGAFVIDGHGVSDYQKANKGVTKNNILHSLVSRTTKNDNSYYRSYSSLASETAYNDEMRNNYNGFSFFHSIYNFNTADICNWSSITNGDSPYSWSGNYLQKRPNLDTLLGVKYYYVEDDYFRYQGRSKASSADFCYNVPFDYYDVTSEYNTTEFRVYKNMNYVDFALTYDNVYEVYGDPLKDRDSYSLYTDVGSKNVLINEELYMKGALINTFRDDKIIDQIKNDYPDITVKQPEYSVVSEYYEVPSWRRYGDTFVYTNPDALLTYYDAFSANKTSLGLSAKDYLTLCNNDNDTFDKYGSLPSEGSDGYRRWVAVFESRHECLPGYDPRGNVYFFTASYETSHDVDIYFVDTNNEIVTYDNHNDGYYNGTRNGKNMRAFYVRPTYGLDENGNIVIVKDAPKIKKIIVAQRNTKMQRSYSLYIDSYTNYESKMNKFREYAVTDVKAGDNIYKFKTNFDKNRVVVTRLAYEDGFKLKMIDSNGKKQNVKVFNGQGGFVSFISGKGECSYVLEFYTPYLAIGSYVSAVSTFFYLTSFVAYFYYGLKKEEEESLLLFAR